MARRNYSKELHDAEKNGAQIVCSVAPYEGTQVHYQPRRPRDPKPWTFTENGRSYRGQFRYSGRECHAKWMHYGVNLILCGTRAADGVQLTDNIPDVTCPECVTELHHIV